jgi:hypothetical protein
MKFELGFLAGFESDFSQFPNDFLRENIVQQFAVGHLVSVLLC